MMKIKIAKEKYRNGKYYKTDFNVGKDRCV